LVGKGIKIYETPCVTERERLSKFHLELQVDKPRLIEFGPFAAANRELRGEDKPETFTFLGFVQLH